MATPRTLEDPVGLENRRRSLFFRRFKGHLMGLRLLSGWGEARGGHQLLFSYFCAESRVER